MATYAVGFGVLFNFIATFTFISFHLAAPPFNLSPAALGFIFTVYLVGTFIVPLVGQGVSRFGRRRFVIAILALWVLGILLTLVPSLIAVIVGLTLAAASASSVRPPRKPMLRLRARPAFPRPSGFT